MAKAVGSGLSWEMVGWVWLGSNGKSCPQAVMLVLAKMGVGALVGVAVWVGTAVSVAAGWGRAVLARVGVAISSLAAMA